ncbi:MAG: hypothetical protein GVY20_02625 [Bacteroidetes bacterium]|jgi:hypothetical protein|nr:hypothetical protein [Bacteroidota bacterium]
MLTSNPNILPLKLIIIIFLLSGIFIINGCDDDSNPTSTEKPVIADIIISPDSAEIAVGEELDFSAVALTATGDTIENPEMVWLSSDPSIFTVQDNGTITGQSPGTAFCGIDAAENSSKLKGKIVPIGLDSAFVRIF